jgi:hypothetical protein
MIATLETRSTGETMSDAKRSEPVALDLKALRTDIANGRTWRADMLALLDLAEAQAAEIAELRSEVAKMR